MVLLLKTFKGNSEVKCSDILRAAVAPFAGKGGGKPDMAQGSIAAENLVGFRWRYSQQNFR
ncbi:MAG: hypothetical protein COC23_06525 [Hyphomicrobiales bacterium]|nr:MAG: hypothetical protein COC23_06525 [Hyphomicrobiales bacterium]